MNGRFLIVFGVIVGIFLLFVISILCSAKKMADDDVLDDLVELLDFQKTHKVKECEKEVDVNAEKSAEISGS